jgi:pyruvate dehydrogenase E2 component (dihydrolipoamide acetyltransferase)
MESGSIASWNVKEGDSFAAGDVFCSVETDKATVDFEAQDEGIVAKILAQAGPADLKVGDPIMVTVENANDVAAFINFESSTTSSSSSSPPPPSPPTTLPTTSDATVLPVSPVHETFAGAAFLPDPTSGVERKRVVASPLAHMIAKDLGYDISTIYGSGPGGRVIAADVKEFLPSATTNLFPVASAVSPSASSPAEKVLAAAQPIFGAGYTDYPLSDEAREAAARLAQSKRNVPHYYLTVDVSVNEVLGLRSKLNATLSDEESLGVYEFLLKATAVSMKTVPSANGSWMNSVVRVYDSVDLNIVVGSGDSLSTPVLRNCATKGLKQISNELKDSLSRISREGSSEASSQVGTFTVLNLGMYGVKSCAPIIREPQSCALAIGALENRIVPNDDPESEDIYKECVMFTATLSCDHRVVDGAVGAQWLSAFKSHVENPETLLL